MAMREGEGKCRSFLFFFFSFLCFKLVGVVLYSSLSRVPSDSLIPPGPASATYDVLGSLQGPDFSLLGKCTRNGQASVWITTLRAHGINRGGIFD